MMPKALATVLAVIAAGSMNLAITPPAHAQGEGLLCRFTPPVHHSDVWSGELDGGPITATSTDLNAPSIDPSAALVLRCVIQVGPVGQVYGGSSNNVRSVAASGTGVVHIAPTTIGSVVPDGANAWICTELKYNDWQYYWDYTNGVWTTSAWVDCGLLIDQSVRSPVGSQCQDRADNDLDGLYDMGDPGCTSPDDNTEITEPDPFAPQCRDGIDNDLDLAVDYPLDADCDWPGDPTEGSLPQPPAPQCQDGADNDFDGQTDYPNDPGCTSPADNTEFTEPNPLLPQCRDGIDNDLDLATDYPTDPDCTSPDDTTEGALPQPPVAECRDGADNDADGRTDYPNDPDCTSPDHPAESSLSAPGPGGTAPPGSPSYHCDGGQQIQDGTIGGVLLRLYVAQPSGTQVDVCFRMGGTGGKIAITPTAPGAGLAPPSTDTNTAACAVTTPPNQAPGPHPIVRASTAGVPYYLDVYSNGDTTSVCVEVGTNVKTRILVPVRLPSINPGTQVAWYPDPA